MDMSEIPAGAARSGESGLDKVRIDPVANAALAEAVRSARRSQLPSPSVKTAVQPGSSKGPFPIQAATALLLIGIGWGASYAGTWGTRDALRQMEAETKRNQAILAGLAEDLASLKSTLAAARDVEHTASTTTASDQAELTRRIDAIATSLQEPSKKLAVLEDHLDRMEGQIMAGFNGLNAPKPAAVAAAASPPQQQAESESAPDVKPARAEPVEGWVLREVYNGSALVESRNHGLYEVMPGNIVPGAGRVEAIERRGARWVVVTDKGFIAAAR